MGLVEQGMAIPQVSDNSPIIYIFLTDSMSRTLRTTEPLTSSFGNSTEQCLVWLEEKHQPRRAAFDEHLQRRNINIDSDRQHPSVSQ